MWHYAGFLVARPDFVAQLWAVALHCVGAESIFLSSLKCSFTMWCNYGTSFAATARGVHEAFFFFFKCILSAVFWLSIMPQDFSFAKLQQNWNGLSIWLSSLTCDQDRVATETLRGCRKTNCSLCIQQRGSMRFGIAVSAWVSTSSAIDVQAWKWTCDASVVIIKLCRSVHWRN